MKNKDDNKIRDELFSLAEPDYKRFSASILPTVSEKRIIGVRTLHVRKIAKRISKSDEKEPFLKSLPHKYYEENNIHAFIIAELDYDECIERLNDFLPFVDNWGTCDGLRPKCFSSHKSQLIREISKWLKSEHVYTVRFAIEMLMLHFLKEEFDPRFLDMAASKSDRDYYLDMMVAWYFSQALIERYNDAVVFLEEKKLSEWVHNKTVSKAIDSRCISPEIKNYLKSLKIKG